MKIKVFLVDDHVILREGLKKFISEKSRYEVVGEASTGIEALEKIEKLQPDIVVMDISIPEMTGIEVSQQICKYWPDIKIIILSRHDNDEYVNQLLKYGVKGYLLKNYSISNLLYAFTEVLKNNIYLCPSIMTKIVNNYNSCKADKESNSLFGTLSQRELQITKLIAEGKSNPEISSILRISIQTVKVHRSNIMNKLCVHKVTDIVRYAVRHGLVEL